MSKRQSKKEAECIKQGGTYKRELKAGNVRMTGECDLETEIEEKPQEGDYIIQPYGNLGSKYIVNNGMKFSRVCDTWNDCITAIKNHMATTKFYPNVWFINDHGNVTRVIFTLP